MHTNDVSRSDPEIIEKTDDLSKKTLVKRCKGLVLTIEAEIKEIDQDFINDIDAGKPAVESSLKYASKIREAIDARNFLVGRIVELSRTHGIKKLCESE